MILFLSCLVHCEPHRQSCSELGDIKLNKWFFKRFKPTKICTYLSCSFLLKNELKSSKDINKIHYTRYSNSSFVHCFLFHVILAFTKYLNKQLVADLASFSVSHSIDTEVHWDLSSHVIYWQWHMSLFKNVYSPYASLK